MKPGLQFCRSGFVLGALIECLFHLSLLNSFDLRSSLFTLGNLNKL